MEGNKGSFFNIVLLFILAILTLTLALLAGFVFLKGDSSSGNEKSSETQKEVQHKDEEFSTKLLYGEKDEYLNLKSDASSAGTIPVAQVRIVLKYLKEVEDIKSVEEKITHFESEIKELIGEYFLQMTRNDAINIERRKKAAEDLTKLINDLLNSTEKVPVKIVYNVIFAKVFCI